MKSRSSLVLIEQTVMILVFALTAALCLRAFLWAQDISQDAAQQDMALLRAQNAAQILKACQGDFEQAAERYGGSYTDGIWTVYYDAQEECVQQLQVHALSNLPDLLGGASVQVSDRSGRRLVKLELRWQEVEEHE